MTDGAPAAGLASRAATRPRDVAILVDGGDNLTFAAWELRSGELATGLACRGIGPGDRVALRFDAAHWAAYALAYVGVRKAGAVAVLVPAGLAAAGADRILRHSGAAGVLCPQHLAPLPSSTWTADPAELERDGQGGRPPAQVDRGGLAEIVYPAVPLGRPRPLARTTRDLVAPPSLARPGRLVHTWAPGSLAGQHALANVLSGTGSTAATLARFSPEALCALIARLAPSTCGLTPGLAAALVASGAAGWAAVGSVTTVVLSGADLGDTLPSDVGADFPRATVVALDQPERPTAPTGPDRGPVGASQLGMLWHEQLVPGSFNLPCLVRRYRGALDVDALRRALAELVRRHEPLRTTFDDAGGAAGQVVAPSAPQELPVDDLVDLAPADRDAESARVIDDASTRPFDLVDGPLFEPRLLRLGVDDHVLVVRLHHTAFDDWSVDVFRRQLSALYAAFLVGEPSPLPEPAVRFLDVCRRQRANLDGDAGTAERAWWRIQMARAPFGVQLPLGRPDELGADRPGAGEPVRRDLPPELARSLRALAPRLRATPFMTVLAAFEVLLAARTGEEDLVIASVVAARGSTALESMIGCFTKKVLLRLRVEGDPTFPELVARTRATVLGALAHQDLPFEAVVQETLGRPASAHGLAAQVPVIFQGETPQQARLVLPGLEVGPYEVPASARRERHFSAGRASREDGPPTPGWGDGAYLGSFLLLSLLESPGGLGLVARGVFSRPAAERLLLDLETLLADISAAPDRRISELALPGSARVVGDDDNEDDLMLRGLRLRRSRIEAALARCPGVAEVAVAVADDHDGGRLVAYVVADRRPAPTLAELRQALWVTRPGSPWPAAAVIHETLPRRPDGGLDTAALPLTPPARSGPPDPRAGLVSALWTEARGSEAAPDASYWQDFSFLHALVEARAAGLPITDEQVARCRTPEMLAAALGRG